jgi:two-component system, chemotaxis family, protein-glutamate methylesterase/glutaminase
MTAPYAIVIGASAGGVGALLELVQALPGPLDAAVGIVLHVGSRHSLLPELLNARGAPNARHARDGEPLAAGSIYVAPPDHHMLFTRDSVRLSRGPRENHARPAIDPLFRSTALTWGDQSIGVVLTGDLDDGTAGLAAIKQCGGLAIVQDPATALEPSMPRSALANVEVDHCLDVPGIARLLHSLASRPAAKEGEPRQPPESILRENAIFEGNLSLDTTMQNLAEIGNLTPMTCPECGGGLWEMKKSRPPRYRCHTGHGFSAASLDHAQGQMAEESLWTSVRALREREMLLRRLAAVAEATGDTAQAEAGRREAERVRAQSEQLVQMTDAEPQKEASSSAGG